MLNKKYFAKVRQNLLSYAEKRRVVIKEAGDAQHLAKKAIFSLQRDATKEAEQCLDESLALLSGLVKKYSKEVRLLDEGSFKAGLEEYTEAKLFKLFLDGKELTEIKELPVSSDAFVSGLCDVPGEMVRYAIKSATERKFDLVRQCYDGAESIINELIDMDLTGYNRQKFDQAKQALQKLQQIVYEVSLKS
jgi:predicted translin family RNA/ssDNA-binding protein